MADSPKVEGEVWGAALLRENRTPWTSRHHQRYLCWESVELEAGSPKVAWGEGVHWTPAAVEEGPWNQTEVEEGGLHGFAVEDH